MEQQDNKYDNPIAEREAPQQPEVIDFLKEYDWLTANTVGNWLDPKEAYVRPRFTLSYNGVPFAPLGGIHGLTGQPGHGKTMTFTQLIVAILYAGKPFYGLRYELSHELPNPKVLYIDTEMEKGNTQLVMLRVYDMMGWQVGSEHEEFKILWLREVVKASERWRMVLKAIYEMKPTVVFLDGLIDVVGDFNDNKECQDIIYACMSTASHYGISLWCLLHENPGSTKMVGHAGSFLERKATDVLKTKKNKEAAVVTFEVSQSKARARDLDTWEFTIEDDEHHYGHPVIKGDTGISPAKASSIVTIEEVKTWMIKMKDMLEWPAKPADIQAKFQELGGLTVAGAKEAYKRAKNIRYIVEQDKSEWAEGQSYSKMKYYLDSMLDDDGPTL